MIGKWCVVIILCCLANIISTRYIDEHINRRGTKRNLKAYRYEVSDTVNHPSNTHDNSLLKRQLIPPIHDERISSDIERELYYSGHDSKDFALSQSRTNYDDPTKTLDPYNPLQQNLNVNFIKNNLKPTGKVTPSEVENAYLASANEKLRTSSEDDKIEAKSRFPEHHSDDDANVHYHDRYHDNDNEKGYHVLMRQRETGHEIDDKDHSTRDSFTSKEGRGERRHSTSRHDDNDDEYDDDDDDEDDEYEPQVHKHYHDNEDDDKYPAYHKHEHRNPRRHDEEREAHRRYEEEGESHRRHSAARVHHFPRFYENRVNDFPHHFKSEHSIAKAFEFQDEQKGGGLPKSSGKSLKSFLRERDRDVYKNLFRKENGDNVLFDHHLPEKALTNQPPILHTDSSIHDNNFFHEQDNFHAIGLTPYRHFSGLSDVAETLHEEPRPSSLATVVHDMPPSISPKARVFHDSQSSNDLIGMNPADDEISPGVQTVHSFHGPFVSDIPSEIDGLSMFHHNNIGLPRESSTFYTPPIHHLGSMPTSESDFLVPPNGQTPSLEHPREMRQPPPGISIGLVDPVKIEASDTRLPSFSTNMLPTQKSDVNHRNDIAFDENIDREPHPTNKRDTDGDIESGIPTDNTVNHSEKQFSNNPAVSVDENVKSNKEYIMQQVAENHEQQKQFDTDVRQEISKLNEQEQNVAASAALQDDKNDLDVAQDLADDNQDKIINTRGTISVKTDSMNRRQLIEKRFRNSHHYIIDREPVHIRHQKYVHLYPFPGKIQHTLSPLYRSLPFRNFDRFGYTPQSHRHFRPIMSGRHNHAFDQIFQGDDDDTEFVAEQPNGYKEAIEDERPSYAQMENGKGLQYMHLGMGAGEVMNHGYPTQVENVGTVSTLPAHDGVTENIVSDLSSGKDLTTVKGEDHVHVQQQEGGNKFSGWLSRPYTYEAHPGKGWGDYGQMNRDISPLNREFPVDVPSRRFQSIRRFPLGFNTDDEEIEELGGTSFNNYNAPIHGSVVSEKDAKKIGLYDSTYLKKLGIWDDTSSIWNSGLPWGMVGIPWGNSGLNNAWSQGLIDKNAELRAINKTSNKEQVVEKACMIPTDIAFLFDASNSSSKKKEYFELFIEFAKQIVGYHQPSAEGYHYGAVYYSNDAQMKFDFEKSYEMNEIIMELDSLKNISLENETSNLEDGLRVTKEELFDKTAREWVYQILVVLTDSKGKGEVGQWAKQLRDSTVNIYVIGMANSESMADIGQMEKLGTRPYKHHVFQVNPDHLLGTSQTVSHPQHLARVIPNQLCRVNLIFLVDLSSNDTNKIEHMKKFIKETTADLGISEYGSHAAVISYGLPPRSHISNSTTTENKENWDLLSKLDHDSFVNAIDNLEDEATSVKNLGNALDLSLKYFTEESGEPVIATFWRYINVTIVMSTNKTIEVENEAQNLRDHGVIIHAIDLGPKDSESPLSKVASSSQEFYLHRQDPSKFRVVAKRMRQYIYQLLFSQESETVKVKGGWEASYGNIMLDEEKYNLSHLPDSLHNNESTLLINNNNNKSSQIRSSNMSPNSTITPLIETLSQEPDWSKYIKTPTLEPSMIALNKDDVELQDKVSEDTTSQSSRNKGTVTRQQINHQKEP